MKEFLIIFLILYIAIVVSRIGYEIGYQEFIKQSKEVQEAQIVRQSEEYKKEVIK